MFNCTRQKHHNLLPHTHTQLVVVVVVEVVVVDYYYYY